ncbi:SDR family NAD(P)-dependent oxidoreductase [Streptomonospora sp. S1-112]|uniref:SDR family NAD(P)-dependent oxidoreductase n=2 Tax=Streptomonospora mangrovi TaxID=2883123 RepID=A0A9X3NLR7_9ACTN|nr:SDR family NAD(P)-dependent oxidoreductase [Streptomonospora mangrovi]
MDAVAAGERSADVCGPNTVSRRTRRPVLVFPGQGSQWEGMGRELAAAVPAFRAAIRRCDAEIARWLGRSLWSDDTGLVAKGTAEVQPALFAIEVALARTWQAWGLAPAAVVGHSMGEIAAAHVSGALSLTDAARIVVERSGLLTELSGKGGLALAELDLAEAEEMVRGREHELAIAALNGPRATVLSGDPQALDAVIADLEGRGVFARRITVEFAAHSPQVEPIQPRLRAALAGIAPGPADTDLYSTVTGEPVDGRDLGPKYWERNVRATVRFAPALERVLADGHDTFIEVAPHPVLIRSVTETAGASGGAEVAVVSSVRRDEDEARGMLRALGELYTVGVAVDWTALYGTAAAHVDLPPHGWEHRSFPLLRPSGTPAGLPGAGAAAGGLLGPRVPVGADPALRLWGLPLEVASAPELADHVVDDIPVVPGAYWLAAAAQAASAVAPGGPVLLEEVTFVQPCPLAGERDPGLQLALRPAPEGGDTLLITSFRAGAPVVHAQGVVGGAAEGAPAHPPLAELRAACTAPESVEDLYERLGGTGLHYGPRFRGLAELWAGAGQALGRIALPEGLGAGAPPLHPALLDACFHTVAAAVGERRGELPLPSGAEGVWSRQDGAPLRAGWAHARVVDSRGRDLVTEVTVYDDAGEPVWSARRLRVTMAARRRDVEEGRLYQVRWQPVEPPRPAAGAGAWLLLADRDGAARALADRLAAAGGRSLIAVSGPATAPDERSLETAGYAGLLAEAAGLGAPLRGAVDLRALSGGPDAPSAEALVGRAADALELTRALAGAAREGEAPRLWLATSGAQTAFGPAGAAGLPGAALWGLGRVVANEHPETACTVVDLDSPVRRTDLEALAALLRAEDVPGQVVLREGVLTPRLAPLPSAAGAAEAPVRGDRTYLVTGGLGALGLQTARWLVERGARHLLLLGRSAPSDRARAAVAELAAAGAQVRVERADTADAAALGAVLAGLGTGSSPALAGVFHLAGVLEDTLVTDLGAEGLRRAMAGKALGAWNLHTLTRDQPVEHFVLFSSMAAVLGSPGQGAYAAANAVLGALAGERAALGLPALCVDWGPWGGSGLAVSAGGVDRLAARGVPPLSGEVAFELLEEAMRAGAPSVVAAAFNWADITRTGALPSVRLLLADLLPAEGAAAGLRGTARQAVLALETHEARAEALRGFLLEQVGSVLGVPAARLDSAVPFQELGFDSLMAVELRNRLESALEVRLSATMVFAHPTVDELTAGLLDRLAPDITAAAPAPSAAGGAGGADGDADGLAELDDDQLCALLAEELGVLDTMEEQ